jgi:hypothetical protein
VSNLPPQVYHNHRGKWQYDEAVLRFPLFQGLGAAVLECPYRHVHVACGLFLYHVGTSPDGDDLAGLPFSQVFVQLFRVEAPDPVAGRAVRTEQAVDEAYQSLRDRLPMICLKERSKISLSFCVPVIRYVT